MPSNDGQSSKVSDVTLPYGTDDEDILRLIEAIKRKAENEKAIREIYDKSNFETSRKALETLGILDSQFGFSPSGKELAVEKDERRRQKVFLELFLNYPPYGHFLESVSHAGELTITTTESVKDYWWKHNYGTSGNNREDGVVAFGKLLRLAGLGKFVIGRRGKLSRIEWTPDAKTTIESACSVDNDETFLEVQHESISSTQDDVSGNGFVEDINAADLELSNPKYQAQTKEDSSPKMILPNTTLDVTPNIAINVDMSDWSKEKIIIFFKAAYGMFDDERETDVSTSSSQGISEFSNGDSDT